MDLPPVGQKGMVLLDGEDISGYLRGVSVESRVGDVTRLVLDVAGHHRSEIIARLPEAQVTIVDDQRDGRFDVVDEIASDSRWLWFLSKYRDSTTFTSTMTTKDQVARVCRLAIPIPRWVGLCLYRCGLR
jgi:hypothetical protein